MRVAVFLMSLVLLFQSSYILAFSMREGVSEATLLVLGVALAPIMLLLLVCITVRRQPHRGVITGTAGVLIMAVMEVILPASPFKTTVTSHFQRNAQEAVEVFDLRDEPLLSRGGNPVGIRITLGAIFPRGGELSVSPTLWAEDDSFRHWQTSMGHLAGSSVDPEPARGGSGRYRFARGGQHRFTVDFLPTFLAIDRRGGDSELCLWISGSGSLSVEQFHALIEEPLESDYLTEVKVSGNTYFTPARIAFSGRTGRSYSLRTFYRSAIAEGFRPCPW